jgi:predicted MFS family arabinose efflux permease
MRFILSKLGLGELRNDPAVRALSLATLLGRIGNGLVSTIEVIYFTLIVGLSPVGVATALGVGGAASLLSTVPAGNIVDRFGAKRVMIIAAVLEGFSILSLIFVQSVFWLAVAVAVISVIGTTFHIANTTVISQIGDGEDRVKIRAAERAMANMGIGIGTVFAGVALAVNTAWAYQLTMLLNTMFYFWAAAILKRVPNVAATVSKDEKIGIIALKDKRFLAATFLNGIVSLHFVIQGVALPLWILHHTDAPKWWVSVLFVINTVLVTVLQIRFSTGTGDLKVSIQKFRIGTLWLLGACVVYSMAGGVPVWVACLVLSVAMLVHTIGELQAAAGSWSIGFDLAEEKHMGQYQAVYSLGWGLGGTFGPLYVTAMAVGLGMTGWWIMGAVFAAAGFAMYWLVNKTFISKQPVLQQS